MTLDLQALIGQRKLLLVGGKGGVGKTTVSASLAVAAAESGRRVLLVSTDPAHSLADALGRPIGDQPVTVAPDLTVLEIDPDTEIDAYLDRVLAQMRRYAGPDQVNELQRHLRLSRQSPGAQEAALMERLAQLLHDEQQTYDLLVLDTAPTGHTLRLLSLPEIMAAWTEGLLRHNKRSQHLGSVLSHLTPGRSVDNVAGDPGAHSLEDLDDKGKELAQTLLRRQHLFRHTRRLLSDPERSAFLFVLTPERLPILETERAIQALLENDIPIAGAIVNRVLPPALDSEFWAARRERQLKHLEDIDARLPVPRLLVTLEQDDIQGLDALSAFGRKLVHANA